MGRTCPHVIVHCRGWGRRARWAQYFGRGFVLHTIDDNGPQCGYVSYGEAIEADQKHVPTHTHHDAKGRFIERAWGPKSACKKGD